MRRVTITWHVEAALILALCWGGPYVIRQALRSRP